MRLIASPKCLRDYTSPLIIANYLMGLRAPDGPCYRPAFILSLIYFLILLSAHITALFLQQELFSNIKLLKLEYIIYELIIYTHGLAVIYKMFLGRYYTKTLDTCYRDVFKVDETLQHLGSKLNDGKLYFVTIITIFMWLIFICITAYLTILHDKAVNVRLEIIIYIVVLRSYGLTVNFITVLDFVIFVRCIQIRFRLINRLLREGLTISLMKNKMNSFTVQDCMKEVDRVKDTFPIETLCQLDWQLQSRTKVSISSKPISLKLQVAETGLSFQLQRQCQIELQGQSRNNSSIVMKYRERKHLLQIIKQVHLALCKVSKKLCAVFGVQISLGIAFTVIMVTGVLYNIYLQLSHNLGSDRNISVQILMAITYSLGLFFLNYICKNATEEGNRTAEIIHSAYQHNPDADIREEIHQFGLQISQSSVKFFAAGLPLDYKILTSYLKAITTYLVIIIEMSNSLEIKMFNERKVNEHI